MCADDGQVTLLLKAMKNGDRSAAEKLLPLVYQELHRLAKSYMQRERRDHTLQPTALINEAYLRLVRIALIGRAGSTLSEWPQMSCAACSSIMHVRTTPR